MNEQTRSISPHSIKPVGRPNFATAETFVLPHGPAGDDPVEMIGDRLELGAPKATVVGDPSPHAGCDQACEIVQR
jgi:hypothetical protein